MGNSNKDNYTPVPNDLLEALCWYKDMTNLQRRIVLYIIRKTYGWNKETDTVSISHMAVEIGATRAKVSIAVNDLAKSNIIKVGDAPNGKPKKMKVLPVSFWDKPVSYREHVPKREQEPVSKREQGVFPTGNRNLYPTGNTQKKGNTLIQKKEKKASPFSDYELTPEEIAEGWEA